MSTNNVTVIATAPTHTHTKPCAHRRVKYCGECQAVHCAKCGKQWADAPAASQPLIVPQIWPQIQPVPNWPYGPFWSGTNTAGMPVDLAPGVICSNYLVGGHHAPTDSVN